MLCVSDEPTYLPTIKENLILNLNKDKNKILQILDLIQNNFSTNLCKDSLKMFSALNGAYLIGRGKENSGGKVIIFSSSNALSQSSKLNGGLKENPSKEEIAYTTHDKRQLGNMGINLTNENMSCDIFCCAETQIKVLTLNQLCEYSNGNIYFYKNFNIDLHYKNLFNQIRRVLSRPICWEGVLRTRFSHGYKISNYLTPVLISNGDLFIYPIGDSDQHVTIGLDFNKENISNINNSNTNYNNNLDYNDNNNFVYIQSALLYSYGDGERRIRVHNLCIPLSSNANDIYNNINSEILSSYYLKKTIDKYIKIKIFQMQLAVLKLHLKLLSLFY
jgi:protein transport protein SEC24